MSEFYSANVKVFETLSGFLVLLALIFVVHFCIKIFVQKFVVHWFRDSKFYTIALLKDQKLLFWVSCLVYITIIYQGLSWMPHLPTTMVVVLERFGLASFILASLLVLTNLSRVVNEVYTQKPISRTRPIKSYLQGIQIVAYCFGFISIIAVFMNKSPLLILSGLGALTAIIMLVFRDSILSLVAGVQLTTNDLIRVGDWIEMPQFNADGDVREITLHTVKVQNWDKTLTIIPAHKFLENSFKNWRGMQESGGRRIKRSLYIDVQSIRFLTSEDIEKFSSYRLLRPYLEQKNKELQDYNEQLPPDVQKGSLNRRRLTNVGTFRAYLDAYLKNHPQIHQDMTFLVRQLQPGPEGLPIELYVFTRDTRWAIYEGIQADIFDHILSILPEFGLRFFQNPTGYDFMSMGPRSKELN
ncbi:mechanosensitive ion channel family protein [Pseudobdellovibrio exovorus]|uniref:Uncharacterized protein n=1 Tax=Pseudobdellovibrio exovorus JSS TaxID=1184267 RepID=M4VA55_9BACT|nr:mechanosensitive ion channel domain-containing protein [Pseudobdellovibrio exovorus]AGH96088.1 hypothetical protein A11Q_1872 [Pseudobdellovibrio exovorus JSS]